MGQLLDDSVLVPIGSGGGGAYQVRLRSLVSSIPGYIQLSASGLAYLVSFLSHIFIFHFLFSVTQMFFLPTSSLLNSFASLLAFG